MRYFFAEQHYPFRAETVAFRAALATNGDSITDAQAIALDTFINDLNGVYNASYTTYNIWSKFLALYPFLGGTGTAHKWNLKDLRDLDAAYRITWYGSPTQDANGMTPNGSTQYGDTHLEANVLSSSSAHMSYYWNANPGSIVAIDMGAYTSNAASFVIYGRWTDNTCAGDCFTGSSEPGNVAISNVHGQMLVNTPDGVHSYLYFNGAAVGATGNVGSSTPPAKNIFIGARNNNGTPDTFTKRRCCLSSIGSGLSSTEAAFFQTASLALQTALGRA